jgi:hypothetical protein
VSAGQGGWIGCDLDATLAKYDGWVAPDHIGEPIMPMLRRVTAHLARGEEVRIFTARVYSDGTPKRNMEVAIARQAITEWCLKHIGLALEITCTKDFGMKFLYDDRAIQIEPNTGRRADGEE